MTSFQTMSARQTVLGVTAGCAPKTENKCQAPERAHPLASFFKKSPYILKMSKNQRAKNRI